MRVAVLLLALTAAVAAPALAEEPVPAPPSPTPDPRPAGFRFHGYLRSGYGVSGEGTAQEAFRAPYADAKYRLGNETEAYVETTFDYGVAPADAPDAFFDTRVTVSYVTPTSNSNAFDTTVSLREAWALGRGVLGGGQKGATFWAGSRFYDRHDLHVNDFYYRDMSGFGGGVEDLSLGGSRRLALAWLGGSIDELQSNGAVVPPGQFQIDKNTFDLRLSGIGLAGGSLQVSLDVSLFDGDTIPTNAAEITLLDDTGWAAALVHERRFGKGRNKLSVQYGNGVASNFRAVLTSPAGRTLVPGEVVDPGEPWQVRVVEDLALDRLGPLSLLVGAVYQDLDNGADAGARLRWLSLGVRPAWHFSRFFSLQAEAGVDHTSREGEPGGELVKVTLGPQLTPRIGALERPSLRAYVTWASWSDAFVGRVAPLTYGEASRGFGAGVQLETWW
jgi:maltoporin